MCIPGRARGAERTQRSSFDAEIRMKRSRRDGSIPFKSLPPRPFLVLLSNNVQKAVRVMLQPRGRDKRSEGGWLHRSFNSPVQIPHNTCGASAPPPPRAPHPEISKENLSGHVPVRLIPNTETDSDHGIRQMSQKIPPVQNPHQYSCRESGTPSRTTKSRY